MRNEINIQLNKSTIKKRAKGLKEVIAGFEVEILSTDFIINPWGEEKPTNYNQVYDCHDGWQPCPHAQYQVKISKEGDNWWQALTTYTDSIHNFEKKKAPELGQILTCILGDAQSFSYVEAADDRQGAQNVMDEFGYNDMIKARDVYQALHDIYLQVKPMVSKQELCDLLDETLDEWR